MRTWLEKIQKDKTQRSFTSAEMNALNERDRAYFSDKTDHDIKAYGCTLIAAFITKSFWFCIQIGDGTCIASYENGLYINPLPEGSDQVANFTNSLCETNAIEKFVHYFEKSTPLGIFVATDGVDGSYPSFKTSLKLASFYREISEPFYKNMQTAKKSLKEKLESLSLSKEGKGSGDDASVAAAISAVTPLPEPQFSRNQLQELLETIDIEIEGKRASIKNNENALNQAEQNYRVGKKQLAEIETEIERIKRIKAENEKELEGMLKYKKECESRLKT